MHLSLGLVIISYSVACFFHILCAGLKLGTEYEMTVLAFNNLGESAFQAQGIVAKTSSETLLS